MLLGATGVKAVRKYVGEIDPCSSYNDLDKLILALVFWFEALGQWFPNFSSSRTNQKNLVVREAQYIDLYRDWRTTSANLADHQRSAEQTLGIAALGYSGY